MNEDFKKLEEDFFSIRMLQAQQNIILLQQQDLLKRLESKLDTIPSADRMKNIEEKISSHEEKIEDLTAFKWKAIGIFSVISILVSTVSIWIKSLVVK